MTLLKRTIETARAKCLTCGAASGKPCRDDAGDVLRMPHPNRVRTDALADRRLRVERAARAEVR